MEALESISLYQNLVYISYAVAVIGLGLSVFFFFYYNIPDVFRLMTGRGKQEKLKKISEENFKTGNIRFNSTTGPTKHSNNARGHTGSIAAVHIKSESQELTEPVAETSVLEKPVGETTVLENPEQETTVLLHRQDAPAATQPAAVKDIHFQVVEQTMLIHTDEQVG